MSHNIEWWEQRLEDVRKSGTGWTARCPAHDDVQSSLSLTQKGETVLIHCFAGCDFNDIVNAAEDREPSSQNGKAKITMTKNSGSTPTAPRNPVTIVPGRSSREWWEAYSGIEDRLWESWGVRFGEREIAFCWEGSFVQKQRPVGTKTFFWVPDGAAAPPLWPKIGETVNEEVWISEGESDCGVLRVLGFDAYAITKGAAMKKHPEIWAALFRRGARRVVFVFDNDPPGREAVATFTSQCRESGLEVFSVDISELLDPLLGEKDIRDVWCRTHSMAIRDQLIERKHSSQTGDTYHVQLGNFLSRPIEDANWLIDGILLRQTIQMIVGKPKLGKTFLALDAGISVATGLPFLGHFQVSRPAPVVYISKEDPDYLLHDRLSKMMIQKGFGGAIVDHKIQFPAGRNTPFFLDLSREFFFTDVDVSDLMIWLDQIYAEYGEIGLVIFDPILRMVGNFDEFKASEVGRAIFGSAEKIRSRYGATVLLNHHRGKGDAEGKNSYGSIAFHAFSDGTLYLIGDEPDDDGWVHVRTEYKSAPEQRFAYRFNDLENQYDPEVLVNPEKLISIKPKTVRELVMVELQEATDGLTVKQLIEKTKLSDTQVRESLKVLEANKLAERRKSVAGSGVGPRQDVWSEVPRPTAEI
jgi:hypothetical protein